jgi:hypothetical protein
MYYHQNTTILVSAKLKIHTTQYVKQSFTEISLSISEPSCIFHQEGKPKKNLFFTYIKDDAGAGGGHCASLCK